MLLKFSTLWCANLTDYSNIREQRPRPSVGRIDLQCRRLDWSFGLEPEHYQNSLPVPIRWYYSLSMLSHALI